MLITCFHVSAQTSATPSIGGSYFTSGGLYPGVKLNYERILLSNAKFEMMANGSAGLYIHYRNHTGAFVMLQSGQRYKLSRKLSFEHYLGLGFLQTFLNGGEAYYVDAAGQIHKASKLGNPHFMPSVSFGFGYTTLIHERSVRFLVRPIIFWQIPFNKGSLVQYGLETGVMMPLRK
jgi:hypothetical protein